MNLAANGRLMLRVHTVNREGFRHKPPAKCSGSVGEGR